MCLLIAVLVYILVVGVHIIAACGAGGLAVGVGVQQEAVPIVYDEEIPLLVRTFRDKSELYVYDAARDFADPSRFEGDLFTEAYTVTFSDTMPE